MTESPIRRLIQGTFSLGFASFLGMALSLLSTMVVTRHFSAEVFGAYTLLRVLVSFLAQISSFGLGMSVAKFISGTEDESRKQALVSTAIIFRFLATILFSIAAWVTRSWLSLLFGSEVLADLLLFVPVLFLLDSSLGLLRAILQGFLRFNRIAITDLTTNTLNLILIVIVVQYFKIDIFGLILARAIALFVSCIFAYFSIPLKKSIEFRFDALRDLLGFGFPLQLNDILSFIYSRVDTLIIGAFLGPADIAFYEIGRRIPDTLSSLFQSLWSVFYPIMAKLLALGDLKRAARLLNDSIRLVSATSILGTAIVLLWGEDLIRLLFSERYLPSAPIFTLLMISLCISLVGNALGTTLVAIGESNKPPLINLIHTTASLSGNLIFIPAFGITGAAIVSLAGPIMTNPLNVFFLLRRKLDVWVMSYLKPFLVFGGWIVLAVWLKPSGFIEKMSLIVLLLSTFIVFSIVTRNDLQTLLTESNIESFALRRRLGSRISKT
jgi:O-antigen/teichoic acid export membrane protein